MIRKRFVKDFIRFPRKKDIKIPTKGPLCIHKQDAVSVKTGFVRGLNG